MHERAAAPGFGRTDGARGFSRAGKAGAAGAAGAALVGVVLFVWALKAFGAGAVASAVERLGAGFAAIVALGGLRHLLRGAAWRLCLDDPTQLSLASSVAAYIAGDALGNVTPFGVLISEPSKIVLVRHRLAAASAIPALAIENLFYGATVVLMLTAGAIALLAAFHVTTAIRAAIVLTVVAAFAAVAAVLIVLKRRASMAKPLVDFARRHRRRLWAIALLEGMYHAAAVFEIWIALRLITGAAPSILSAFVLEFVNRAITVAFQFVPMWLGVDEAGTGLMTSALGLTGATGVALALARKARIAVWTAVGFLLLGGVSTLRGAAPRPRSSPHPAGSPLRARARTDSGYRGT